MSTNFENIPEALYSIINFTNTSFMQRRIQKHARIYIMVLDSSLRKKPTFKL